MKVGIIYVLFDPRETEPHKRDRYVGKTIRPANVRLRGHITDAITRASTHKSKWICKLIREGVKPGIKILEHANEDKLNQLEIAWIARLREQGYKLTNGTDGGDGPSGWHHTEETRRKMREAAKNRPPGWRHHSEETKQKLSEAAKNRPPISQETREKKRQSMLGVKHSEEAKKRHSQASSGEKNGMYGKTGEQNPRYGKPLSAETKDKISKANKGNPGLRGKDNPNYGKCGVLSPTYGRKMSEEQIQKLREINTGRKHTDEARKKMSDKLKGRKLSSEHRKNLSEAAKEMHRKRREKLKSG